MPSPEKLKDLLAKYEDAQKDRREGAAELEIRFRGQATSYGVFASVQSVFQKQAAAPPTVEKSVACLDSENHKVRKGVYGQDRPRDEYYYKERLDLVEIPNQKLAHRVVLSLETPTDPFRLSAGGRNTVRVKLRTSYTHPTTGNEWRYDFTVVKTLPTIDMAAIKAVSQAMFVDTDRFLASLPAIAKKEEGARLAAYQPGYSYEIEAEHTPTRPGAPTPEELAKVASLVIDAATQTALAESSRRQALAVVARALKLARAPGSLKSTLSRVATLTKEEYARIYPPAKYLLLDKADGRRALALVRDKKLTVLSDTDLHEYAAHELSHNDRVGKLTIVDGELVDQKGGAPAFYGFDVISIQGVNVAERGYEERATHLKAAVSIMKDFGVEAYEKGVVRLTGTTPPALQAQFAAPAVTSSPYETDGLILVEPGEAYTATKAFKWKPPESNTIDMLARLPPAAAAAKLPPALAPPEGRTLYFLFVGAKLETTNKLGLERVEGYRQMFPEVGETPPYAPIQFTPSFAPMAYVYHHPGGSELDGGVHEFVLPPGAPPCTLGLVPWSLVRTRDDRAGLPHYYGNDFYVAEMNYANYVDPLAREDLWGGVAAGYFASAKPQAFNAPTAFTSMVKSERIAAELSEAAWVVDAGSGKGQDYFRYQQAGVQNLVAVDSDCRALTEMIRRRLLAPPGEKSRRGARSMYLYTLCENFGDEAFARNVRGLRGFPPGGADGLVANLSFHYLCGSAESIQRFARAARRLVKKTGVVVITCMFGEKVHALLTDRGVMVRQSWDAREGGVLKYSIRRLYDSDELTPAGQKIGVVLPFSGGAYYEEFLVNTDYVAYAFKAQGFALRSVKPFGDSFPRFQKAHPQKFRDLTPDDRTHLSLYGELVFELAPSPP